MNWLVSLLLGPEVAAALLATTVVGFGARFSSRSPRDHELLKRAMWWLPVIGVPLIFSTLWAPGARSWWWLGRANGAATLALLVSSFKLATAYGPTRSRQSGARNPILNVLTLGIVVGALANAAAGALILAKHQAAFAGWFHDHRFIGCLLTLLAAVPIGLAMTLVVGTVASLGFAVAILFNR